VHRINRLVADEHLQGLKARISFLCARKRSFQSIVPDRVTLHVFRDWLQQISLAFEQVSRKLFVGATRLRALALCR